MRWIDALHGPRVASVLVVSLAVTSGCGTVREQGVPDRNTPTASSTPGTASLTTGTDGDAAAPSTDTSGDAGADAAAAPDAATSAPSGPARTGPLAHFYTALDGLASQTRRDHVRVLWLGDSHGQADFWTGRVRKILQKRFGNGGPGFVHIAYKGYRHDGVDLQMKDKWATRPRGPATGLSTFDGVFGLGGLLTSSDAAGSEASVEVRDTSLPKKLTWDLCYRFNKPGESIRVSVSGHKPTTLTAGAKIAAKPPLLHTSFTTLGDAPPKPASSASAAPASTVKPADSASAAPASTVKPADSAAPKQAVSGTSKGPRLEVAPVSGVPFFCGVVVETDPMESPGVVLDALGINGARYTTALAWDEEAWLAELSRRSPALVIFEYGTNESGDVGIKVDAYSEKVGKLVARVRKNKPDTDCVILAPTERADQEERSARIRDILRDAAKENACWFWDTIETMGGKGAMRAWRAENPPKGAKDGVHLTVRGYQELGDKLAADLLKKYGAAPTPVTP